MKKFQLDVMEIRVMDFGSLEIFVIECRFRLRSAFDSYSVASEAFSEKRRLIPIGVERRV